MAYLNKKTAFAFLFAATMTLETVHAQNVCPDETTAYQHGLENRRIPATCVNDENYLKEYRQGQVDRGYSSEQYSTKEATENGNFEPGLVQRPGIVGDINIRGNHRPHHHHHNHHYHHHHHHHHGHHHHH